MSAPADRDPREVARRVLEIDERATKGPWRWNRHNVLVSESAPDNVLIVEVEGDVSGPTFDLSVSETDQDLIADYRTAAPILARSYLAALEAMRLAREALQLMCVESCSSCMCNGAMVDAVDAIETLDAAMKEPKPDVTKEAR